MTTTATFVLPGALVPAAQAIIVEWTYLKLGPYDDGDAPYSLRELDDALLTIGELHQVGAPGRLASRRDLEFDTMRLAHLRRVAGDISRSAADLMINGYDLDGDSYDCASTQYWTDLKDSADSILEAIA